MADTDEKIDECIEKSLNYLSAIGRPIDLKYEQRISIQHLLLGKDVIAILPTGFGKCTIFRGGPLDILGGGVSDPKKKFMQEIELEKKIPACA